MKITKLFTIWLLSISSLFLLAWCNTKLVQQWNKITVSYDSNLLKDWSIVESWKNITFTVWMWQTFPIFDKQTIGMKIWESKVFTASVDQWYGIYHDTNKIQNITNTVFNKIWTNPKKWEIIKLWKMEWLVLETGLLTYKIDFNQPETREAVKFKIKVLDIAENK